MSDIAGVENPSSGVFVLLDCIIFPELNVEICVVLLETLVVTEVSDDCVLLLETLVVTEVSDDCVLLLETLVVMEVSEDELLFCDDDDDDNIKDDGFE